MKRREIAFALKSGLVSDGKTHRVSGFWDLGVAVLNAHAFLYDWARGEFSLVFLEIMAASLFTLMATSRLFAWPSRAAQVSRELESLLPTKPS